MPSIDLSDNINNDNGIQEDEIPLPQQDPTLIDTAFIHWESILLMVSLQPGEAPREERLDRVTLILTPGGTSPQLGV